MSSFKLVSRFKPSPNQAQAIKKLTQGVNSGHKRHCLLGVTGSGKTYVMANLIKNLGLPTLVISHNKTLAAQLYQEYQSFFPQSAVSYFVSYYDYYQPEAYLPRSDTYIEKEADINEEIDKLRLAATTNLLTRRDVIIAASVSCIYNIGSPKEHIQFTIPLKTGEKYSQKELLLKLSDLQYERHDLDFSRGSYRLRGESLDIYPPYSDQAVRAQFKNSKLVSLVSFDPLTGHNLGKPLLTTVIYPAKHYLVNRQTQKKLFPVIKKDLKKEIAALEKAGRQLEAQRLSQRVNYDLEMIEEFGYVNGIENYSRYFDNRRPGDPPYSLIDYFPRPFLTIIDESHLTIPQLGGMYRGDLSRKQALIDFGFRLKASFDNRPLKASEIWPRLGPVVHCSATPGDWELKKAGKSHTVELLTRPTGLIDPPVTVLPSRNQISSLVQKCQEKAKKGQRVLVTTLTKRMAEELSVYLEEKNLKTAYLHSDISTLERSDILKRLRMGDFDILVGVNLLREGLDLPEVSLVAILDADKEGFLRSRTSLVQTMGRAARHLCGEIILYADQLTSSMKAALDEVTRRRAFQLEYNRRWGIIPKSVKKPIRKALPQSASDRKKTHQDLVLNFDPNSLLPQEKKKKIINLRRRMRTAAADLNFELAAQIRDLIQALKE